MTSWESTRARSSSSSSSSFRLVRYSRFLSPWNGLELERRVCFSLSKQILFRFRLLPYNRSWTQAGPSRNLLHEEYEGGQKIAGFNGKKGYHSRFQGSCSFPRDWGLCSWVLRFCGRLCCEFGSAAASQVMWKWDDLTGFRFFDFPLFYWFLFILVLCSLLLDRSFYSKIICDLFFIRSFSIFRVFPLFIEFMSILLYWITTSSVGNGFVIGVEQNKDLEKKYDFTSF